jgi:hypothetical protein
VPFVDPDIPSVGNIMKEAFEITGTIDYHQLLVTNFDFDKDVLWEDIERNFPRPKVDDTESIKAKLMALSGYKRFVSERGRPKPSFEFKIQNAPSKIT